MIIYFASTMTYSNINNYIWTDHYPTTATDSTYLDFDLFVASCILTLQNNPVFAHSNSHLVCNSARLNSDGTLTKIDSNILNFYNLKPVIK